MQVEGQNFIASFSFDRYSHSNHEGIHINIGIGHPPNRYGTPTLRWVSRKDSETLTSHVLFLLREQPLESILESSDHYPATAD